MNIIIEIVSDVLIAFGPWIAVVATVGLGALLCPLRK
jgi:hypothetical protein